MKCKSLAGRARAGCWSSWVRSIEGDDPGTGAGRTERFVTDDQPYGGLLLSCRFGKAAVEVFEGGGVQCIEGFVKQAHRGIGREGRSQPDFALCACGQGAQEGVDMGPQAKALDMGGKGM
jgi:hypothetical protein